MLNKLCPNCPTETEREGLFLCEEGLFFYLFLLKSCSLFLTQVKRNHSPFLVKLSPLFQAKMNLPILHADVHCLNFCYSSEHILPCIKLFASTPSSLGFPGGTSGKESTCQLRKNGFNPWIGKILLKAGRATHSSILA